MACFLAVLLCFAKLQVEGAIVLPNVGAMNAAIGSRSPLEKVGQENQEKVGRERIYPNRVMLECRDGIVTSIVATYESVSFNKAVRTIEKAEHQWKVEQVLGLPGMAKRFRDATTGYVLLVNEIRGEVYLTLQMDAHDSTIDAESTY